jgi:hypothetical protein
VQWRAIKSVKTANIYGGEECAGRICRVGDEEWGGANRAVNMGILALQMNNFSRR